MEMEQYIEHTATSDLPMMGIVHICAWCNRVKVPGTDARKTKSWKIIEQVSHPVPGVFMSHGICPICKSQMKP